MSKYKIYLSVGAFLCIILCANAESISPAYQAYIEKWKATALAQQAEFGIPASITLAQGLLESGAGQSDLARLANNHFGIKCHNDWQGKTYRKDAETRNECYRSYKKAEDSFRDHSLFLTRKRYEVLFTYNIKDYKKWAHGLKSCGYATDPKYPQKLITIIETYGLDKIVSGKAKGGGKQKSEDKVQKTDTNNQKASGSPTVQPQPSSSKQKHTTPPKQSKQPKQKTTKPKKEKQAKQKAPKQKKEKQPKQKPEPKQSNKPQPQPAQDDSRLKVVVTEAGEPEQTDTVEWKPSQLRSSKLYGDRAYGRTNGRRFIVAQEGDTWGSLAYQLGMEEKALRRVNEATSDQVLRGGDRLYFLPKRSKADRKHTRHLVQPGETAWDIAQRYGMKMSSLYKINGIPEGTPLTTEQWIELR